VSSLVAALGLAFAANAGADAAGFQFSPQRVDLTSRERVATISVTNIKDVPLRLEVQALTWSQRANGQPILVPSSALLVFPQLLTIPPHEHRRLRVATTEPAEARESTYEVSITEIGSFAIRQARDAQVNLALQIDLPVFIAPNLARRAGTISQASVSHGTLRFSVVNTGTVHFVSKDVSVTGFGADTRPVLATQLDGGPVLAEASREYSVVLPRKKCDAIRALAIHVEAGDQLIEQTLDLPAGACNS
jgi:P pilus assembly chaperone PapD